MERPPDLGRRLRAAREYKGLSQSALADAITDVSQSSVVRYENGQLPEDRKLASLLEDWARICEVPADWFTAPWGEAGHTTPRPDEPVWVDEFRGLLRQILSALTDAQAAAGLGQLADDEDSSSQRQAG